MSLEGSLPVEQSQVVVGRSPVGSSQVERGGNPCSQDEGCRTGQFRKRSACVGSLAADMRHRCPRCFLWAMHTSIENLYDEGAYRMKMVRFKTEGFKFNFSFVERVGKRNQRIFLMSPPNPAQTA